LAIIESRLWGQQAGFLLVFSSAFLLPKVYHLIVCTLTIKHASLCYSTDHGGGEAAVVGICFFDVRFRSQSRHPNSDRAARMLAILSVLHKSCIYVSGRRDKSAVALN
jgi:hypothetical protein